MKLIDQQDIYFVIQKYFFETISSSKQHKHKNKFELFVDAEKNSFIYQNQTSWILNVNLIDDWIFFGLGITVGKIFNNIKECRKC